MSNILWRCYLEDDVDKFRSLLAAGSYGFPHTPKGHTGVMAIAGSFGAIGGSPSAGIGTPPRSAMKSRKASSGVGIASGTKIQQITFTKNDLNSRDRAGMTILHRAVSSTGDRAVSFAMILIEHPAVDIYLQDYESGWTSLHRALYFGNIIVARALMERDSKTLMVHSRGSTISRPNTLYKIKDHEGNSPFDVYNATIARRTLPHVIKDSEVALPDDEDGEGLLTATSESKNLSLSSSSIEGDEIYAFGSNKNLTLGFGDQDDRQHPERVYLKRPEHLIQRFYQEHLQSRASLGGTQEVLVSEGSEAEVPTLIRNRPIVIQDVALSKLHSAILTADPESNLYMCGFGPGGRLGTGDETTRFTYVCIEGGALEGKKVAAIALGQNHSLAVSSDGGIFTWGTNTWGMLGYSLPRPTLQDEEPLNSSPRQVFGPLKREIIIGVAASAIHSVAHTDTSLYTWGKNDGQLGLMDSDSRSLEAQTIPRKVGASLFTSPIVMVSAINKATICLLANHSVYVFTNYGYNNVKFPLYGGFSNSQLSSTSLTTRYEAEPSHISLITSGGDTIAAVSSRGDLFTVNINQRLDSSPTATSTTNPAKIKNSLSPPQRIWSLRKGNWDGIKSVDVGENGSVIICTQAGAVWRRVKRATIKDALATGAGDFKAKDYKFQRVPGLTKVVAVRSNVFGSYAAIRKDSDVTKTQVLVTDKMLWNDLAPLLSIKDLVASTLTEEEISNTPRFWTPAIPKDLFSPIKRAVLTSKDLEIDIALHLQSKFGSTEEYDGEVCTTLSDISLPIHVFMLAGRSSIIRQALAKIRKVGSHDVPELMTITSAHSKMKIEFRGFDFITILNLVLYVYTDTVADVWHFTRHVPKLAYRYRQIRTEMMKLAAKLNMSKLESAVRFMTEPERQLNTDFAFAFQDPVFFEDGNAVIELNGGEMIAHSALLRKRCPFFEGLFNGRAGGQWLASRRNKSDEPIRIDMKHVDPSTFKLVLRFLYTDIGRELFDDILSPDIDTFSDLVMDVMFVANELMLDRLSQICQQVIGCFVNTRNVCNLVNAVAPCSATHLKDAGLEYICLQLEAMLENHLLDDLDEDLLLELGDVVRDNQLGCLPFAKSGRADLLLHERHPSLAGIIAEELQRIIRDMIFQDTVKDDDNRLSSSFRTRFGSPDDSPLFSPSQDKLHRKAKRNAPFSPVIQSQDPSLDLMFKMDDDEESLALGQPASPYSKPIYWNLGPAGGSATVAAPKDEWQAVKGKSKMVESPLASPPQHTPMSSLPLNPPDMSISNLPKSSSTAKSWTAPALPSTKLGMKDIMAQALMGRTSSLSVSLSAEKTKDETAKETTHKLSQKERKKQQQKALQEAVFGPQVVLDERSARPGPTSPWRNAPLGPKIILKEVMVADVGSETAKQAQNLAPSSVSKSVSHRRTQSPDTRFAGQQRSSSGGSITKSTKNLAASASLPPFAASCEPSKSSHLIPHSKSYVLPSVIAEPPLQLSMADIIGQQKLEQEFVKEATTKRSLQEIQEEQAFQEWWDQESLRAQEEEALRMKANATGGGGGSSNSRGKNAKKSRGGGRGRGRGQH